MAKSYGKWKIESTLGEGGQAHTFMVRRSSDGVGGYVLKRLKNSLRERRFEREVEALRRIKSEFVPQIVDVFESGGRGCLVTEYAGRDLAQLLAMTPSLFTVENVLRWARELAAGLADAHKVGVIHRDLKPNNIVVADSGRASVIDFGICSDVDGAIQLTSTNEGFGNQSFSAPECSPGSLDDATKASDVYSLGKVLYWMCSSGRLIAREHLSGIEERMWVQGRWLQHYLATAVRKMVRENPGTRISLADFVCHLDFIDAKMLEHGELQLTGRTVLWDGFGVDNAMNRTATKSATTPGRGNPPGHQKVGVSFDVAGKDSILDSLSLGIKLICGPGHYKVELYGGTHAGPGELMEQWTGQCVGPQHQVVEFPSAGSVALEQGSRFWVVLSVEAPDSEIAWISASTDLLPFRAWIYKENEGVGRAAESSGPGYALRVLGRDPMIS